MTSELFRFKGLALGVSVATLALLALVGTCPVQAEEADTEAKYDVYVAESSEDIIGDPEAWAEEYPNEYNSYIESSTLPYGLGYGTMDKTGKATSWVDVQGTDGAIEGICLHCHTTEFSYLYADLGGAVVEQDYSDARETIDRSITCYTCHANDPSSVTLVMDWIVEAAEKGNIDTDVRNLVCAQCHSFPNWSNATNPDSSTWSTLQAGTDAEAVWEYYQAQGVDNPKLPGGEGEFNAFYGSVMERAGAVCTDCHSLKVTADDGTTYMYHAFQGAEENPALFEQCLTCHVDSTAEERQAAFNEVKADYEEAYAEAQAAIDELTAAIEKATEGGADEQVIADATYKLNKATFYFNYASDPGKGIHSVGGGSGNEGCFDKAVATAGEGMELLK